MCVCRRTVPACALPGLLSRPAPAARVPRESVLQCAGRAHARAGTALQVVVIQLVSTASACASRPQARAPTAPRARGSAPVRPAHGGRLRQQRGDSLARAAGGRLRAHAPQGRAAAPAALWVLQARRASPTLTLYPHARHMRRLRAAPPSAQAAASLSRAPGAGAARWREL